MDKGILKKQYNKDFEQLRKMMNDWDPMGLRSLGCPEDEYDQYTNRVLSILYRYKDQPNDGRDELNHYLKGFDEDIKEMAMGSNSMDVKGFTERILDWFKNR